MTHFVIWGVAMVQSSLESFLIHCQAVPRRVFDNCPYLVVWELAAALQRPALFRKRRKLSTSLDRHVTTVRQRFLLLINDILQILIDHVNLYLLDYLFLLGLLPEGNWAHACRTRVLPLSAAQLQIFLISELRRWMRPGAVHDLLMTHPLIARRIVAERDGFTRRRGQSILWFLVASVERALGVQLLCPLEVVDLVGEFGQPFDESWVHIHWW